MYQIIGKIEFNNGLRVKINDDFCFYYKSLIEKSLYKTKKYQTPEYGAHLTIYNPKIHRLIHKNVFRPYIGVRCIILYDPTICIQGKRVDMFYFPAECALSRKIKKELVIFDGPDYHGDHITICNRKNIS